MLPVHSALVRMLHGRTRKTAMLPVHSALVRMLHGRTRKSAMMPVHSAFVRTLHRRTRKTAMLPVHSALVRTLHGRTYETAMLPFIPHLSGRSTGERGKPLCCPAAPFPFSASPSFPLPREGERPGGAASLVPLPWEGEGEPHLPTPAPPASPPVPRAAAHQSPRRSRPPKNRSTGTASN